MSKKRLAASLLVVLFGLAINILIFMYKVPLGEESVTIELTFNSNCENGIEVFYLTDDQKLSDGFLPGQSSVVNYKKVKRTVALKYTVPRNTSYFRMDLGAGRSESNLEKISLVKGKSKYEIAKDKLLDVEQLQAVEVSAEENGVNLKASTEDPYIVWSTKNWDINEFLYKATFTKNIVIRLLACLVIDFILIVIIKAGKKMIAPPKEVFQNRKLLMNLAKNDFKTKYAGSYLGIIWAFIQPIVTVLVYWFVFEKGLKAGGVNTHSGINIPFVLWLVAGLVPWFFFQDALNGGTNALIEYSYLVKKVVFKISILPIVKVVSALFVHVFFVVFTLVLFSAYRYFPDLYTIQILYYTFAMFIMVLGLVYATCAIVIFFRDLTQIINIVLQVGMWMTPIMWNIDTMDLSPVLITIFKLNPMYYIVAGYRDALINKVWFWENMPLTVYFWLLTAILFGIGSLIFKRLKIHFADVL